MTTPKTKKDEIIGKAVRDICRVSVAPAAKSAVRVIVRETLNAYLRMVERTLPKDKPTKYKIKNMGKELTSFAKDYGNGYNKAIKDVKARLKELAKKE